MVGFARFSELLEWVGKLPVAFQEFVVSEKRQQLSRTMKRLGGAFGIVNNECVNLARLMERAETRDEQLRMQADVVLASVVELHRAVLAMAADLGEETGKAGTSLAFELALFSQFRVSAIEAARRQVLGGERVEAARNLRQAAGLAERAQKLTIEFLPTLSKTK